MSNQDPRWTERNGQHAHMPYGCVRTKMYALDLRPVVALPRPVVAYVRPFVAHSRSIVGRLHPLGQARNPSSSNPRSIVVRSDLSSQEAQEGQCLQAGQGREGGIKKGLGALEQGELAWGFRTWRISEGFGAFGAGGINKGLGAWAPSRSVVSP